MRNLVVWIENEFLFDNHAVQDFSLFSNYLVFVNMALLLVEQIKFIDWCKNSAIQGV